MYTPWSDNASPEDTHYLDNTGKRYIIREFDLEGNICGFIDVHMFNGAECVGSISIKGRWWAERGRGWTLEGEWPEITLTPSVLCTRCNNHGYIVKGKWVSV